MKSKLLIYSLILCSGSTLFGQQAVTASGGNGLSSSGSMSFTVGQVSYQSVESNGSVSEGVQQAFEIYTVGISDFSIKVELLVYPNPTADQLTLQCTSEKKEILNYRLKDASGKLLLEQPVTEEKALIDLLNYANGAYFLEVFNAEKSIQTFKIIKNK